jgi:hypothetical protein
MLLRFALSLLPIAFASILAGQQNSSVLDWLTDVQTIKARLRSSTDADITLELRSLHHEIAQWNAAHPDEQIDVPEMATAQTSTAGVLKHVSELRRALEEHEKGLFLAVSSMRGESK